MAASGHPDPAIAASSESLNLSLPNGACNFRSLDAGQTAPICGCQRFWLNDSSTGARAWCFCGHHACFHVVSGHDPNHSPSHDYSLARAFDTELRCAGLPSTAPPSIASDQLIRSISGYSGSRPYQQRRQGHVEPIVTDPYRYHQAPDDLVGSATEVNTPSPRLDLLPHLSRSFSVPLQSKPIVALNAASNLSSSCYEPQELNKATTLKQSTHAQTSPLPQHGGIPSVLQNIIHSYARRLETLENSSFAHVPAEEIQEKFELVDGRLLDLETWRTDAQPQSEHDNVYDKQHESSLVDYEASQRLSDIEERLNYLEEVFPSYACPWEIEVVLLPWGESLRGIWSTPPEIDETHRARPNRTSDEWNGLASPKKASIAYTSEGVCWMPTWSMIAEEGLVPKAPGPNSVVFRRLQSRGLVRKVAITDGGAHNIWRSISNGFNTFLVGNSARGRSLSAALPDSQGLRQPIIPLRKVRGSPYLQFLATHEMVTPSLWDYTFLKSGVLMKIKGSYRLYCTTPDAYVQADGGQWSWSRLQEWHPQQEARLAAEKGREDELDFETTDRDFHCWNRHPVFDAEPAPSSPSSSFISSTRSETQSPVESDDNYSRPASAALQQPTSSSQRVLGASSPSSTKFADLASQSSKRGLLSLEESQQKRRRTSRSVEAERRLARLTPRWSSEPESPRTPEGDGSSISPTAASMHAGLQFAYATPHSNNAAAALYLEAGGDTEADSDSAMVSGDSLSESENEWEGVVDDELTAGGIVEETVEGYDDGDEADSSPKSSMMSSGEEDVDEDYDNLDDGLTIYEAHL